MKKLKLNKERIAQLTNEQSAGINGGASTRRTFTCGWCTGGNHTGDGASTCNCSTPEQGTTCPPGY